MSTLSHTLAEHAFYHHRLSAKIAHYAAVILLAFGLLIPLSWLQLEIIDVYSLNVAWLVLLVVLIYYLTFDFLMAVTASAGLALLAVLASIFSLYTPNSQGLWVCLGTIAAGIILQLAGLALARRMPPWKQMLSLMLQAPLLLTADIYFICGCFPSLKAKADKLLAAKED